MKIIDCKDVKSEDEFWSIYLKQGKPEGADHFGRNLNALFDALTGGGPGWVDTDILRFINTDMLEEMGQGTFFRNLKEMADNIKMSGYPAVRLEFGRDAMNMTSMNFSQYDVVRVIQIRLEAACEPDLFNKRAPKVGDVATIVEVYDEPPGYELECSDKHGITEWLIGFKIGDVELELVQP